MPLSLKLYKQFGEWALNLINKVLPHEIVFISPFVAFFIGGIYRNYQCVLYFGTRA
jgi:hypothetical protein